MSKLPGTLPKGQMEEDIWNRVKDVLNLSGSSVNGEKIRFTRNFSLKKHVELRCRKKP